MLLNARVSKTKITAGAKVMIITYRTYSSDEYDVIYQLIHNY